MLELRRHVVSFAKKPPAAGRDGTAGLFVAVLLILFLQYCWRPCVVKDKIKLVDAFVGRLRMGVDL